MSRTNESARGLPRSNKMLGGGASFGPLINYGKGNRTNKSKVIKPNQAFEFVLRNLPANPAIYPSICFCLSDELDLLPKASERSPACYIFQVLLTELFILPSTCIQVRE